MNPCRYWKRANLSSRGESFILNNSLNDKAHARQGYYEVQKIYTLMFQVSGRVSR